MVVKSSRAVWPSSAVPGPGDAVTGAHSVRSRHSKWRDGAEDYEMRTHRRPTRCRDAPTIVGPDGRTPPDPTSSLTDAQLLDMFTVEGTSGGTGAALCLRAGGLRGALQLQAAHKARGFCVYGARQTENPRHVTRSPVHPQAVESIDEGDFECLPPRSASRARTSTSQTAARPRPEAST